MKAFGPPGWTPPISALAAAGAAEPTSAFASSHIFPFGTVHSQAPLLSFEGRRYATAGGWMEKKKLIVCTALVGVSLITATRAFAQGPAGTDSSGVHSRSL
jgi:hypothetical protein